jgi:hypothetical protein
VRLSFPAFRLGKTNSEEHDNTTAMVRAMTEDEDERRMRVRVIVRDVNSYGQRDTLDRYQMAGCAKRLVQS